MGRCGGGGLDFLLSTHLVVMVDLVVVVVVGRETLWGWMVQRQTRCCQAPLRVRQHQWTLILVVVVVVTVVGFLVLHSYLSIKV